MQIDLPPRCTLGDADDLKLRLVGTLDTDGDDVTVDASAVTQVGTAVLQLLLALKIDLQRQGRALRWQSPSQPFVAAVQRLFLAQALEIQSTRS